MNEIRISAEQFRRDLTELLSQAGYGGATVVIERHGTPLAALIPYQEYQKRDNATESPLQLRETRPTYEARTDLGSASVLTAGVLTIEEAAAHLRTSVDAIKEQVESGEIPARRMGNSWRFSRSAPDQWLQPQNSRSTLLAQAGLFAGDSSLDEILAELYQRRGRPETEPEEMDVTNEQIGGREKLM